MHAGLLLLAGCWMIGHAPSPGPTEGKRTIAAYSDLSEPRRCVVTEPCPAAADAGFKRRHHDRCSHRRKAQENAYGLV